MSKIIHVKKHQGALLPSDTMSQETIKVIKENQLLTIKLLNDRNVKHHQKYRAILQLAFENQERYATIKSFHNAIKIANGFCDMTPISKIERRYFNQGFKLEPHSTAFDEMSQKDFTAFFDKVVPFLVEKYFGNNWFAINEALEMIDANTKVE